MVGPVTNFEDENFMDSKVTAKPAPLDTYWSLTGAQTSFVQHADVGISIVKTKYVDGVMSQ